MLTYGDRGQTGDLVPLVRGVFIETSLKTAAFSSVLHLRLIN